MTYDSQKHHRRSVRLKGYDYSQAGAYFISVCVQDRACVFGEVTGSQMQMNDAGRMVLAEWDALPARFPGVELDAFVVMPNHVHGIIVIAAASAVARPGATTRVAPTSLDAGRALTDRVTERSTADMGPPGRSEYAPVGATLVVAPVGIAPVTGNCEPATVARPGATTRVAPTTTIGDIVGAFKSLTTDLYIHGVRQLGWPAFRGRLWQRNYHDHIIRNDESLHRIRQYIVDNPACWSSDAENPREGRAWF